MTFSAGHRRAAKSRIAVGVRPILPASACAGRPSRERDLPRRAATACASTYRIVDIGRELVLPRPRRYRQGLHQPVVQRPVVFEPSAQSECVTPSTASDGGWA